MNLNGIHREPTTQERPIYGSSRLGIMNKAVVFNLTGSLVSKSNSTIGIKEYELSDHLGNVDVVILDRKNSLSTNIQPVIISNSDYYPFGYPISFRTHSTGYRYGFNGQEKDNEVYGDGKSYTAEYWQYDSRLGRRWNVDPVIKPSSSGFSTFANNPISFKDFYGLDSIFYKKDGSYEIRKGGKEWNPSTSPWQKEINKAFGWMINTTILGVALPEFGGDLLGFSIEATPEIMGSIKTGTAFVKYQSARAAIFGGKIIHIYNSTSLYMGACYQTGMILGVPFVKIGTGISLFSGLTTGYFLNDYNILPPDITSQNIFFDIGLNYGQIIKSYKNEFINQFFNKKNEEKQKESNN
jgi:hypothetical protein